MAALFVWLVHGAYKRDSLRWLAWSGIALGLCLLTKTTLIYLTPVFGLALAVHVWHHRSRRDVARIVAIGALPLLLLAPWFAWNLDTYGTITANSQAGRTSNGRSSTPTTSTTTSTSSGTQSPP